jgi:uncharacterized membrane protein YfcA
MGVLEAIAIFAAGVLAGTINSVVGSGTLITFPVLLAFGYAPRSDTGRSWSASAHARSRWPACR